MRHKVLESFIESRFCKRVEADDNQALKLNGLGKSGKPDRLILMPLNTHFFIEFKRPGQKLRPLQEYVIARYRKLGHTVFVIDDFETIMGIYEDYKTKIQTTRVSRRKHSVFS